MPQAQAQGGRLHFETAGQGAPVLLIGGLGSDASFWDHQFTALCDDFRVIRYDPRGMSRSEPLEGESTIGAFAQDAVAVLDAARVKEAHVVGHSMGGAIAQALALHDPNRVERLVLTSTFPRGPRAGEMRSALWPAILEHLGSEAYVDNVLAWGIASSAFEARWDWVQSVREASLQRHREHPVDVAVLRRQCDAIRAYDMTPYLTRIAAPTLVVVGDEDILTPPVWSRQLAGAIPNARLELISGVGHLVPWEVSRDFNRLVADFLRA